jgi:putative spermidine/putrescine transport system ATP-binding protein
VRKIGKADVEARSSGRSTWCSWAAFGNRMPAQLSGGQQQRVRWPARWCSSRTGADGRTARRARQELREQMQYEIKHIHDNLGVTVVYVTHDQTEALTMSNRIAVFNDGIIQQLAPPADLYERPRTAFVAPSSARTTGSTAP